MNISQQFEINSVLQMGTVPQQLKATKLTCDRETQARCRPGWRLCMGGVCSLSRLWACELDKCHRSCPQQCITATSGFNMRQTPPRSFHAGFESSPATKKWRMCHGIRQHRELRTSLLMAANAYDCSVRGTYTTPAIHGWCMAAICSPTVDARTRRCAEFQESNHSLTADRRIRHPIQILPHAESQVNAAYVNSRV